MEIFQWLFKLGKAPRRSESCSIKCICIDHEATATITSCTDRRTRRASSTRECKQRKQRKYGGIWLWCRKDVADACFYSNLTLRRFDSFNREHFLSAMAKMKAQGGEEKEVTSTRFDPNTAIKGLEPDQKHEESNKEKAKSEQSKAKATLSRMKELIRWAAAAKSDKAVKFFTPKIMDFKNRRKLREASEESKRVISESANISLRRESSDSTCTTLSSSDQISIVSAPAIFVSLGPTPPYRCRSRKGNWITTDSEFVVLEL